MAGCECCHLGCCGPGTLCHGMRSHGDSVRWIIVIHGMSDSDCSDSAYRPFRLQ